VEWAWDRTGMQNRWGKKKRQESAAPGDQKCLNLLSAPADLGNQFLRKRAANGYITIDH